jgi:hypothetical protein
MPMPELKTYRMVKDNQTIGYLQGWPWMIPQVDPGVTLEELTDDALPPYTPPQKQTP